MEHKIGVFLTNLLKSVENQEQEINVIVRISSTADVQRVLSELAKVGFRKHSSGSLIITGSIAAQNIKALAALSFVLSVEAPRRLFTC
ncbi:MAG: hypothetical protein KGI50_00970 [Patescibacteria group bacterium]|nr:hypothetical protein [Patescibacteria group bacterium]MDE2438077.1 hypothetical protein [Patescibacteria group bacterium]